MIERKFHTILVQQENAIVSVMLNRPERRNAIGPMMVNELLHVLADAHEDKEARVIVLTGAGKAFCAGGDFAQMTGGAEEDALPIKGDYADLLLAMCQSTLPILARVNGHAMGGGLGLVAASTFAIASTDAELGTPEINVGLFPMMIMAVLARLVPRRRLVEMMLTGERISATEAVSVGILNRAVAPEQLDDAVKKVVDTLLAKSSVAVHHGLEAFFSQDDLQLKDALPELRERLVNLLGTEDAREGLMAFLEKRKPVWMGR